MSINERIRHIRKDLGLSQEAWAPMISLTRASLAAIETGRQFPTIETIIEIVKNYHNQLTYVTYDWIIAGEPEKKGKGKKEAIVPAKEVYQMPRIITVDSSGDENILFVPVRARAGYLLGYADETYISNLPTYRLPGLNNGTFRMFEIGGLSMHPTFDDHDIIITQWVENINDVRDDRVYVVVTRNDGVVVKRVLNRITKEGKLILKSDNYKHREEYPPIVIEPSEVVEIWYGIAYMSRQMRPPAEMYMRMIDLEARVTFLEQPKKQ